MQGAQHADDDLDPDTGGARLRSLVEERSDETKRSNLVITSIVPCTQANAPVSLP